MAAKSKLVRIGLLIITDVRKMAFQADLPADAGNMTNESDIVVALARNGPIDVNTGRRPEEPEMSITVRYRSDVAVTKRINIQNGCCIYYSEHNCCQGSQRLLVPLPNEDEINRTETNDDIKKLTCYALGSMKNGFILEYKDRCIYARRRCRSTIYYYSSQLTAGKDPVKLKTNETTKIFDYALFYNDFSNWYKEYLKGRETELIRPKICFSFGQSWQPSHKNQARSQDRPQPTAIDTCLVSMYAVPLQARDAIISTEGGRNISETLTMGLNSGHLFLSNEENEKACNEERLNARQQILAQHDQNRQLQEEQIMQLQMQQQQLLQHQQQLQPDLQQQQQQQQQQRQLQQQQQQQQLQQQLQYDLQQQQYQDQYYQHSVNNGFQFELQQNNGDYVMNDVMMQDESNELPVDISEMLSECTEPVVTEQFFQDMLATFEG